MNKYTDARYPEKINDLIDNEGNANPEVIPSPEDVAEIKQELMHLKAFDGDLIVTHPGSNYAIESKNLPENVYGVYRLIENNHPVGIICFHPNGTTMFQGIGIYNYMFFKGYGFLGSDYTLDDKQLPTPQKTYIHKLQIAVNGTVDESPWSWSFSLKIYSSRAGAIDQLPYFLANILTEGCVIDNGEAGGAIKEFNFLKQIEYNYQQYPNKMTWMPLNMGENVFLTKRTLLIDQARNQYSSTIVYLYDPDEIDLETGKIKTRTNLISSATVTYTDSVIEL